ncbi:MAG TPA: hypothetical protein VFO77_08705, partial [Actinoplanes sp.]|nr:hypothetical protein [Actinoplanes sp.]
MSRLLAVLAAVSGGVVVAGSSRVSVDLVALAELADGLARFAGDSAFVEAQAANQVLNAHAPFGTRSASGVVAEARAKYTRNMVAVVQSAHEYAREAAKLAVALRKSVAEYSGTDSAAAAAVASAGGAPFSQVSFIGPAAPRMPQAEQVATTPPPQHVAVADDVEQPGWCTNWSAYDATAIWQMVEPDDVCTGGTQELAWRRVTDSLAAHQADLKRMRAQLQQVWSSPTASDDMFLRLDRLITSMGESVDAAAATRAAIGRINAAIAEKKPVLQRYAEEYAVKSDDLTLRQFDNAEDKINNRARIAMSDLEAQVREVIRPLPEGPRFEAGEEIRIPHPPEP